MAVWASSSSWLARSTVAVLLVFLHISAFSGPCEAQRPSHMSMFQDGDSIGREHSSELHAAAAPAPAPPLDLTEGVRYRPPIINMKNFGGPVMWRPLHLYFVWYGTWTEAQKNVLRTATNSLTPKKRIRQYPNLSNLWTSVTQYYQEPQSAGEPRRYATNSVSIRKEIDDHYSIGKKLNPDTDPLNIILSHVGKDLPKDLEQGMYFIFTSGDVTFPLGGFCGYHDDQCSDLKRNGTSAFCNEIRNRIVYSFVPLSSRDNGLIHGCNIFANHTVGLRGLPPNHKVSPDGAIDTMVIVYLHELLEATVDPYPQTKLGWIFNASENSETSDLCSWNFVAGDWNYCNLPSVYPDFPGVFDRRRCYSLPIHHKALTEPKSHAVFNTYGIDGSQFIVQMFWSLTNKGCVSQPEEACSRSTVVLRKAKGTIQRGVFFNGVGLQHYAPGQNCEWKILVHGARYINLVFETVALGLDDLDYVTVARDNVVMKKVTRFGKNIKVKVSGNEANIHFVTYGKRSPYPSSAGFILHYEAEF